MSRIEYTGKGNMIKIETKDYESFLVAIDLVRQIALNQSTDDKNLEFLNQLEMDIAELLDDGIGTESDLDELIDTTIYDHAPQDALDRGTAEDEDDLELWLDIEDDDEKIESDDDEFNIPRYVDLSTDDEQAQIDFWNDMLDFMIANKDIDEEDYVYDPYESSDPEDDLDYEDDPDYEDAIEIPVIIEPHVHLVPGMRVECPDCGKFTLVDHLHTTFTCVHCNKAQFSTKDHNIRTYHCPVCDKMNKVSLCTDGIHQGVCINCSDYHLLITKLDGTIELF